MWSISLLVTEVNPAARVRPLPPRDPRGRFPFPQPPGPAVRTHLPLQLQRSALPGRDPPASSSSSGSSRAGSPGEPRSVAMGRRLGRARAGL